MKKMFTIVLLAVVHAAAVAQFSHNYEKAADAYFIKGDYYSAAQYYEKFITGQEKNAGGDFDPYAVTSLSKPAGAVSAGKKLAVYRLAECYRLLHYPAKAEKWYLFVTEHYKQDYPLARFRYAVTMRELQRPVEAEQAFRIFLKEYAVKDMYSNEAARELDNLVFAKGQLSRDISSYTITKLPAQGGGVTNYAPVFVKDTLLFTAAVTTPATKLKHINHVFQAVYKEGSTSSVTQVAMPMAGDMHQGTVSVAPDGNTLFLTQWTVANGKKQAAIYRSKRTQAGWGEPELLDKQVNVSGCNAQQPCVTGDGKYLLYASDRPGGTGGWDIWYAELDASGNLSKGGNMGSVINSAGDEQAPYYHQASETLVFASNGKTGMGGYDLFYAKGKPGQFAVAENMGYPVNSTKDDIYFAGKPGTDNFFDEALISSDRASECCLDLFYVKKTQPAVAEAPVKQAEVPVAVAHVPAAEPAPVEEEKKVIPDVYFALNKAQPLETSFASLDRLVVYLKEHSTLVIEIGGHTDITGEVTANQQLSEDRAKNVAAYLVSKGIATGRVRYKGYGSSMPVAPNTNADGSDNPEGRKLNRRTEYKVLSR